MTSKEDELPVSFLIKAQNQENWQAVNSSSESWKTAFNNLLRSLLFQNRSRTQEVGVSHNQGSFHCGIKLKMKLFVVHYKETITKSFLSLLS